MLNDTLPQAKETNRVSASAVPKAVLEKLMKRKLNESLKKGSNAKEFAWENFLNSKLKMKDDFSASKYLSEYINYCKSDGENIERICYELFLDFSEGRSVGKLSQPIKSDSLAELMATKLNGTRDYEKLLAIIRFYESRRNVIQADGFYMTLYEIFHRGEGVEKNLNKAVDYLKAAINISNTPNRREALREIYQEENFVLPINERMEKAYEKVIADGIRFSKTDYAKYLKSHDRQKEALHWFVADANFSEAYEVVNLKIKEDIDLAINEFKKGAADSQWSRSLKTMQEKFNVVQDIFLFKEEPLSYSKLAVLYSLLEPVYALYRLSKLGIVLFSTCNSCVNNNDDSFIEIHSSYDMDECNVCCIDCRVTYF